RREDGRLSGLRRQDPHPEGRQQGPRRAAGADERPDGLRRGRPDRDHLRPGPGPRDGGEDRAGVPEAAVAAERPHRAALPGREVATARGGLVQGRPRNRTRMVIRVLFRGLAMFILPERQTERLSLTRPRPEDFDDLLSMYTDPRVMATLGGVID